MRKGRLRGQSEVCLSICLIGSDRTGPRNSGIVLSMALPGSLGSDKALPNSE